MYTRPFWRSFTTLTVFASDSVRALPLSKVVEGVVVEGVVVELTGVEAVAGAVVVTEGAADCCAAPRSFRLYPTKPPRASAPVKARAERFFFMLHSISHLGYTTVKKCKRGFTESFTPAAPGRSSRDCPTGTVHRASSRKLPAP